MSPTVAIVQALVLAALFPALRWLWRTVAQKDSDVAGGQWSFIWMPIGGVGAFMAINLCLLIDGAQPRPEMVIPLGVGFCVGFGPFVLATARLAGLGRTRLGRLLGISPPTPKRFDHFSRR